MENEFYTEEFEQLLKEKADQFRMYPSKRVWHSIYNNLHPSRRWPSVAMSILLITSLMLIGYLNTGDNSLTSRINTSFAEPVNETNKISNSISNNKVKISTYQKTPHQLTGYVNAFADVITNETDFYTYTVVRNNRPDNFYNTPASAAIENLVVNNTTAEPSAKDVIQSMDLYIKTNQLFADIPVTSKKNKSTSAKTKITTDEETIVAAQDDESNIVKNKIANNIPLTFDTKLNTAEDKLKEANINLPVTLNPAAGKHQLTAEEKAWIENYALQNKPKQNKWKGRLAYQIFATPAVNYRKLTTNSKGSITPFANSDINNSISQKPGFGIETGIGVSYSATKDLFVKAGVQFNYTNYNINADQTNHPIITTILLNDPATGYSYSAARTSSTANSYNTTALQPVILHNRTYQLSVPVGFAYKLSSEKNVEWFAGATVQPTYVFGGNAHIISSDLKSYVSDPSSIRSWNLNLGFETFMNFKLGGYSLQVGPQVRYQIYSTYRKNVALIEKPYAVGLKLGLTRGF